MIEIPDRVVERVHSHVAMGHGGCHISTYSTGSHGYAQIGWNEEGRRFVTLCHLVAWRSARGTIPTGWTVDHECKSKRCFRVDHLRLLPNLENARRHSGRDWPLGQCVNGHPDAEYWRPSGAGRMKGYCAACKATY